MTALRFEIENWENWGKLVKSWATGRNYFGTAFAGNDPKQAPPHPKTLAELKQQCDWANVGITVDKSVVGLVLVQSDDTTLLVRLPPRALIEEVEESIQKDHKNYPLPSFYNEFWGTGPGLTQGNVMKFHAQSLGNYSVMQCG